MPLKHIYTIILDAAPSATMSWPVNQQSLVASASDDRRRQTANKVVNKYKEGKVLAAACLPASAAPSVCQVIKSFVQYAEETVGHDQ